MAVRCECIDVIIPIANIDRVYPGGFAAFKRENTPLLGGTLWHDNYLFRDGAMSPSDARAIVDSWRRRGLEPTAMQGSRQVWNDLCVVERTRGGPTLPCDWLEFNAALDCVQLKGAPVEPVVGREQFSNPARL